MTDSAVADHAASDRSSRRALLGAGVLGAALALAGSRSASAGTALGLSDADRELATAAIGLELAARDLYDAAIEAGADGDEWAILRGQHWAYATRLAGLAGTSARGRNDEVFASLESGFGSSDPLAAAQELENVAAATHIASLEAIADRRFAEITAAIAAMESRHATVLGIMDGQSGDELFTNPATPLEA